MATVSEMRGVGRAVREAGFGWAVYADHLPASVADTHEAREVGCVVVRVNAGRTERFVSAAEALAFVAAAKARRDAARAAAE
jgi:hypothetical protein